MFSGDPDLFVRVAENALTVAEDLRTDYFESTLGIAREMRETLREGSDSYALRQVPRCEQQPCAVAFVDGGLSRIDLGLAVPLIVRAGIFRVKQGEHDLEKRETFDHFPLMLGQLRGGLKAESKYGDVVRLIVELGALVTALEDDRFSDIRMLMLHGPLQFVSGPFFEHWFFPQDYEAMLGKDERSHVLPVLSRFSSWCQQCPLRQTERCVRDITDQHLPAVCMMAFLQQYIIERAAKKDVLVCGVVERSFGRSMTKHIIRHLLSEKPELFERLLKVLELGGRGLQIQSDAILDATRYNDALLLALALKRGEYLDWYGVNPSLKTRDARIELFPEMQTTFVRTATAKYPMRIEAPAGYGSSQLEEILVRSVDYAGLLPNYAFPLGLDIVDKYAAIPGWMTKAYKQLILAQYGRLLAGEYVDMDQRDALKTLMVMQGDGRRDRRKRPEA